MPISGTEPGGPAAKDAVTAANRSIERASQRLARGVRPSLATVLVLVLAAIAFSVWAINDRGGGTLFAARLIDGITNGTLYGLMALALVTTLSAAVLFQPALLATQSKSHSDG